DDRPIDSPVVTIVPSYFRQAGPSPPHTNHYIATDSWHDGCSTDLDWHLNLYDDPVLLKPRFLRNDCHFLPGTAAGRSDHGDLPAPCQHGLPLPCRHRHHRAQ